MWHRHCFMEREPRLSAMIDALFQTPNLVAARQLLDVTVTRHRAIAANLANLETPGYRRVDVPEAFEKQLQQAIGSGDLGSVRSMHPMIATDPNARVQRPDGNTVDLEMELVRLQRNSVEHAVESHFVTGALMKLRHAITGRSA